MFTIQNTRRQLGDNSFITAKGRPVTLRPGKSLQFGDDELNDGLLRTMIGKGSHYKVIADSAEAQEMIDNAQLKKASKSAGSPLVHGSMDPPDFNRGRDHPIVIRDLKEKVEAAPLPGAPVDSPPKAPGEDGKPVQPNNPPPPPKPEITKVFIKEEVKEKSPLAKLIEVAAGKPYTELVTEARSVLGDKFPEGRPGRPAIIKALEEMAVLEKLPAEPQE